jgi:avirulence protein
MAVGSGSLAGSPSPRASLPSSPDATPLGGSSPSRTSVDGSLSGSKLHRQNTPSCTAPHPNARTGPSEALQSTLGDRAALVGVARWANRYNREDSDEQKAYGKAFSAKSMALGDQIRSGKIKSMKTLWEGCREWRADYASDAGQPKSADFKLGRGNMGMDYSTPIANQYEFIAGAVAKSWDELERANPQQKADATDVTLRRSEVVSKHTGNRVLLHCSLQQTVKLGEKTIPLTEMVVYLDPETRRPARVVDNKTSGIRIGMMIHTDEGFLAELMTRAEELFKATRTATTAEGKMDGLAELHWLLAQAMPDARGSAAKSEMVVRSMAYAMDMELQPFARGSIPDLEAFVKSKTDFINGYGKLFEPTPATPSQPQDQQAAASTSTTP